VGLNPPDDAAVMQLDDQSALVFTVDFFPPVVDDPAEYGRIAANNALNDVYAMGGQPTLALSIAAFPTDLPSDHASEIVRGAAQQCAEAGAVLAGGHTIRDEEPKFGLAVVGRVPPDRIWRKSGAMPGDVVLITKPIGSGIMVTARRRGVASDEDFRQAVGWMLTMSRDAVSIISTHSPHAVTDVTGFGLAGHASEVADLSNVRITIDLAEVPLLKGARDCAAAGIRTSADATNRTLVGDALTYEPTVDDSALALAVDPQTAGGLMVVVAADRAGELTAALSEKGLLAAQIGRVEEGSGVHLAGRI
jgi:selenide,water dikinase